MEKCVFKFVFFLKIEYKIYEQVNCESKLTMVNIKLINIKKHYSDVSELMGLLHESEHEMFDKTAAWSDVITKQICHYSHNVYIWMGRRVFSQTPFSSKT